jgi:hypothetical protein
MLGAVPEAVPEVTTPARDYQPTAEHAESAPPTSSAAAATSWRAATTAAAGLSPPPAPRTPARPGENGQSPPAPVCMQGSSGAGAGQPEPEPEPEPEMELEASTTPAQAVKLRSTVKDTAGVLPDILEVTTSTPPDASRGRIRDLAQQFQTLQAFRSSLKAYRGNPTRKSVVTDPGTPKQLSAYESRCTLHVRGIGGKYESEEALRKVFGKFGKFVHATVRHREDKETGTNTSWALVTMADVRSCERGLKSTPLKVGGNTFTITRYNASQAANSNGQMQRTLNAHDVTLEVQVADREKQELLLLREERVKRSRLMATERAWLTHRSIAPAPSRAMHCMTALPSPCSG